MGVHFNPIIPTGALAQFLAMGWGGSAFFSMDFPWLPNTRAGSSIGFGTMHSKIDYFEATITMLPMTVYIEYFNIFWQDFRPYARFGLGMTGAFYQGRSFASSDMVSTTSWDTSLDMGLGIGYRPKFLPQLEFLIYANLFIAVESNVNNFVMLSIGTNYIF